MQDQSIIYDVIIIGAGPSGLFAGTLTAMNQLKACIIESSSEYGGQLTLYREKAVYDMPGFSKILAGDLVKSLYDQYLAYSDKVPLFLNTQAKAIKKEDDYFILITDQGTLKTKTMIMANGGGMFQPKKLDIEHIEEFDNIMYYVQKTDIFKDKDIVILGGGDSAVDWGLTLLETVKSVTLIHRRHDFRAHEQNVVLLKEQATVLTPYQTTKLSKRNNQSILSIKNLETNEEKDINFDYLLVFYGMVPVREKLDQWGMEIEKNAFKVTCALETSVKHIYAIGNSVTYEGKLRMIVTGLGEAATAVGQITKTLYPNKMSVFKH